MERVTGLAIDEARGVLYYADASQGIIAEASLDLPALGEQVSVLKERRMQGLFQAPVLSRLAICHYRVLTYLLKCGPPQATSRVLVRGVIEPREQVTPH